MTSDNMMDMTEFSSRVRKCTSMKEMRELMEVLDKQIDEILKSMMREVEEEEMDVIEDVSNTLDMANGVRSLASSVMIPSSTPEDVMDAVSVYRVATKLVHVATLYAFRKKPDTKDDEEIPDYMNIIDQWKGFQA